MDEENINMDEIRQMILNYMQQTSNVESVLNDAKEEYDKSKNSFKLLWEGYDTVATSRNKEVLVLRKAALKIYFASLLTGIFSMFNRSDAYIEMNKLYDSICKSIDDLKDEKELLLIIKNTIKELEKYNAYECNYDISLLLALINDKHSLMYDITTEDIKSLSIRMRGISYMTDNNNREELKNINENIDYKVKELKLKKTY